MLYVIESQNLHQLPTRFCPHVVLRALARIVVLAHRKNLKRKELPDKTFLEKKSVCCRERELAKVKQEGPVFDHNFSSHPGLVIHAPRFIHRAPKANHPTPHPPAPHRGRT